MKNVKFYNLVFPTFTLFLIMPSLWLIALPVNLIVDSLALLIILAIIYKRLRFDLYKKVILPIWFFGFLADVPGAVFLSSGMFNPAVRYYEFPQNLCERILTGMYWVSNHSIIADMWSLLYMMSGILISAGLVFLLDYYVFKLQLKDVMSKKQRIIASLIMAIATAPYAFLLPKELFY